MTIQLLELAHLEETSTDEDDSDQRGPVLTFSSSSSSITPPPINNNNNNNTKRAISYDGYDDYESEDLETERDDVASQIARSRSYNILGAIKRSAMREKGGGTDVEVDSIMKNYTKENKKDVDDDDDVTAFDTHSTDNDNNIQRAVSKDSISGTSTNTSATTGQNSLGGSANSIYLSSSRSGTTAESAKSGKSYGSLVIMESISELSKDVGTRGKQTFATLTATISNSSEEIANTISKTFSVFQNTSTATSTKKTNKERHIHPTSSNSTTIEHRSSGSVDDCIEGVESDMDGDVSMDDDTEFYDDDDDQLSIDEYEADNEEEELEAIGRLEGLVDELRLDPNHRISQLLQGIATTSNNEYEQGGDYRSDGDDDLDGLTSALQSIGSYDESFSDTSSWDEIEGDGGDRSRDHSLFDDNGTRPRAQKQTTSPRTRFRRRRSSTDIEQYTLSSEDETYFDEDISLFPNGTVKAMESFLDELADVKGIQKLGGMILRLGSCHAPSAGNAIFFDDDVSVLSADLFNNGPTTKNMKQHKTRGRSVSPRSPRPMYSPAPNPPLSDRKFSTTKAFDNNKQQRGFSQQLHTDPKSSIRESKLQKFRDGADFFLTHGNNNTNEDMTIEFPHDPDRVLTPPGLYGDDENDSNNRTILQTLFACAFGQY